MADYRASEVERITMDVGEVRTMESLRQAVVPPYVMIVPFVETPPILQVVRQDNFDEEGVNGCTFTLRATHSGQGIMRVGFRDLRENKVVIEKKINVTVE